MTVQELRQYEHYNPAIQAVKKRARALGVSWRMYQYSDEYKALYPILLELHERTRQKYIDAKLTDIQEKGLKVGDRVKALAGGILPSLVYGTLKMWGQKPVVILDKPQMVEGKGIRKRVNYWEIWSKKEAKV